MSRDGRPRRTFLWLLVLAAIGVAILLGGRDLFEGLVTRMKERVQGGGAPAAGTVSGTVRFEDGVAAEGARVSLHVGGAETLDVTLPAAPDGSFRLPLGERGPVETLRAERGPLTTGTVRVSSPGAEQLLTLPSKFDVAGLVQTGVERMPVASARVSVAGVSTVTDEAGSFTLKDVPASAAVTLPVRVTVAADGYAPLDHAVPPDALPAVYGDLLLLLEPVR